MQHVGPKHAPLPADIGGISPFRFAVFVSFLALLPVLFVPSFRKLSWLNLIGCLSTVLVTLTMAFSVAYDPDRTKMPLQVPLSSFLVNDAAHVLQALEDWRKHL